jgi:hypothetical protein
VSRANGEWEIWRGVSLVETVLGEFFESGGRSGWSSVLKNACVSVPVNVQKVARSNMCPDL